MKDAAATSPAWLRERMLAGAAAFPRTLRATLPEAADAPLAAYVDRVLAWGARINLTGASDAGTFVDEHLVDALPILSQLPAGPFRAIDVGSGAGLPGAVLAALRPDSRWTLLEPNQKKAAFLAQIRRDFVPAGIELEVRRGRIEELDPAEVFDLAISRAVWDAEEWLRRGRALVRPGGLLIGLRTATADPPPQAARELRYTRRGRTCSILRVDVWP